MSRTLRFVENNMFDAMCLKGFNLILWTSFFRTGADEQQVYLFI
jgi:hypothetical protein